MSNKKFSYKIQYRGEQNLLISNGCKELYYKIDIPTTKEQEKETNETINENTQNNFENNNTNTTEITKKVNKEN